MAPPSTPNVFPTEDMLDILIQIDVGSGEDMRPFKMWKGVLCFYSGYFNSALNGRFVEGQSNRIVLPTEDPKIFELFRTWLYTRRFYQSTLAPSRLLPFDTLVDLWVFADAHHVPLLQNVVSDLIPEKVKNLKTFPNTATLTYVEQGTAAESQLRKLLHDLFHTVSGHEYKWAHLPTDVLRSEHQDTHVHEIGVRCDN